MATNRACGGCGARLVRCSRLTRARRPAVYCSEGLFVAVLLFVASCTIMHANRHLRLTLLSTPTGFWGLFNKGAQPRGVARAAPRR